MVTDPSAPKLGLLTKFLYGTGSIGYGIKDVAFRSFLLLYYNQVVGVRAELVSFAILVALVVDAISDPVVGQWSDSIRPRLGRRHPLGAGCLSAASPARKCPPCEWHGASPRWQTRRVDRNDTWEATREVGREWGGQRGKGERTTLTSSGSLRADAELSEVRPRCTLLRRPAEPMERFSAQFEGIW